MLSLHLALSISLSTVERTGEEQRTTEKEQTERGAEKEMRLLQMDAGQHFDCGSNCRRPLL